MARTRKANKLKEDEICWDDLCSLVQIPFDKQPGRSLQVHMQEFRFVVSLTTHYEVIITIKKWPTIG